MNFVYHVAAPRPQGGFFLLSSRADGGGFGGLLQQQVEDVDAKVRASLILAVNKAEQERSAEKPPQ
jgi:hypothetical protein